MRSLFVLLFFLFNSAFVFADLPLKESSSEWFWQGIYAFAIALVLLGLSVIALWLVKTKMLPNAFFRRTQVEEVPFTLFPNQRIQILSSKKLSVKTKVILISVDDIEYLVFDNGQSTNVTPHRGTEKKDEKAYSNVEASK